ncbi:sugar phosphate isomerase/epimerase [Desulfobaculum xiamenense]|uniref:Sugar phosphate isomerase/epimerase n=1 Tax=Desulfobaculum xiamenense TaxID=995050 RepID=A0A846QM32_9BACT|nr:cobamide remodeling phosphodiesterase CbiR [Desulfobaculum xiamenense]NJB68247.1 sugar phosphate isomerase/epimerase [Desulfobaculum xiamenense]
MSYRQIVAEIQGAPRVLAAPSFVIPSGVAENCRHLAGLFPEVALLFFESDACLRYTDEDLPPWLAQLGLRYHVHLPLDLPWEDGADAAWRVVERLVSRAAFLSPQAFVLHPPARTDVLAAFADRWEGAGYDPAALLLENTRECDLARHLRLAEDRGLALCLDLGHMLAYEQEFLAEDADFARVRMLHLNAPGPGGRHLSLAALDERGQALVQRMLDRLRPDAVLTIEVFEERGLMESARVLLDMLGAVSVR